jgi:class 3 adenylate cyclase/tetratricopeptide (TPR) repeat protein
MSDIIRWLTELGLGQYGDVFTRNDIDADVLPDLSESDLEQLGVSLGHRKKLMRAIAALGERRAVAERRQATVLFSDLSGYTAMNEALDPEDVESLMSRIKSSAVAIVEHHGGIVNQFVGDEVLALFGIPSAHDDDPVRAVRAALELHAMVREISPEVEGRLGQPVRLHTGINTGLIVTHLGDDRDGRIGVTGDAVNTGARLKALAQPDAILLGPDTMRRTGSYFTTAAQSPVTLKGKGEAITPHRVTGTTEVSSRFAAAERHGLTPFTGRSREIGQLRGCLATALDRQGQLVTVVGNPGAGKSRLLFEFRQSLDEDVLVLQGRCQAFGRDRSYAPFTDVLVKALRLDDDTSAAELREQAIANLLSIDASLEKYLPHFLELLSMPGGEHRLPPNFEGEEKRRAFDEALAAFVACSSRVRPVVLLLEDWHWSDEASDSAVSYLIPTIRDLPVLVLVAHRPELAASWGQAPNHTPILLEPLDRTGTEAMVAHSLGVAVLPDGLGELIHSRADGNPLFIEEVCRSLIEDGTVRVQGEVATLSRSAEELVLPDTVSAVIRGRLDRLDEQLHEPLRLAAVIGHEFDRRILERVCDDSAQLDDLLSALVAQDVIQQAGAQPDTAYRFKHVLVQVVVYETMLLRRRRELHAQVGRAMEEVHSDRLAPHLEELAHHFDLGEVWGEAAAYRVGAGMKAAQHHVIAAALMQFDRAREILAEHLPEVPWRVRYDLCLHRGAALGDRGQWPLALEEVSEAEAIAAREGDVGLRVQAQVAHANAAFWSHEFDEALSVIAELETLLGGNPDTQLRIASQQALINFMLERLPTALAKEKEAQELFDAAPRSPNRGYAAFVIGTMHRWRGENEEAEKFLELAVEHDKSSGSAGVYLQSLMHYCIAIGEQGRYQAAIDLLLEGREYGLAADSLYGLLKINNTLGWAYLEVCAFEQAREYNEMSLRSIDETRGSNTSTLSEVASFARLNLGDLHLATGCIDLAEQQYEAVAENLGNVDFFLARTRWKPRCLIGLGEVSLARGDVDRAEAFLADLESHGFAARFPFKKHQARAGRLEAGVLAARGRVDAATEVLEAALEIAHSVGNPVQLWKLHVSLGNLLAASGEEQRATSCYANARAVIEDVAGGLRDSALKAGFLAASPIQEVLSR